jgi:hypothetical protein
MMKLLSPWTIIDRADQCIGACLLNGDLPAKQNGLSVTAYYSAGACQTCEQCGT